MAVYGPVPGLKWRTSELWVLNRWVFNFCVRSTPLRGGLAIQCFALVSFLFCLFRFLTAHNWNYCLWVIYTYFYCVEKIQCCKKNWAFSTKIIQCIKDLMHVNKLWIQLWVQSWSCDIHKRACVRLTDTFFEIPTGCWSVCSARLTPINTNHSSPSPLCLRNQTRQKKSISSKHVWLRMKCRQE